MRLRQTALVIKAQSEGQGQVLGGFELVVDPGSNVLLVLQMAKKLILKLALSTCPSRKEATGSPVAVNWIAGGVPACGFRIAEVIAAGGICVPDVSEIDGAGIRSRLSGCACP